MLAGRHISTKTRCLRLVSNTTRPSAISEQHWNLADSNVIRRLERGAATKPEVTWNVSPFSLPKTAAAMRDELRDEVLVQQASCTYRPSKALERTLPLPFGGWSVPLPESVDSPTMRERHVELTEPIPSLGL